MAMRCHMALMLCAAIGRAAATSEVSCAVPATMSAYVAVSAERWGYNASFPTPRIGELHASFAAVQKLRGRIVFPRPPKTYFSFHLKRGAQVTVFNTRGIPHPVFYL